MDQSFGCWWRVFDVMGELSLKSSGMGSALPQQAAAPTYLYGCAGPHGEAARLPYVCPLALSYGVSTW
jgi:hypothetical protein